VIMGLVVFIVTDGSRKDDCSVHTAAVRRRLGTNARLTCKLIELFASSP
jgi:hypothetical protein